MLEFPTSEARRGDLNKEIIHMDVPVITVSQKYKTPEEKELIEFFTECARDGHFETIKGLVKEAKVDINGHNSLGLTAFKLAYWNKHYQITNFLIEEGVIDCSTNFVLDEPIVRAPIFKLDSVLEQTRKLLTQQKHEYLLIEFVRRNCKMIVKGLIEEVGVDINSANYFGLTPLKQAIKEGHLAMVDFLISKGVDVNASNPRGETPLMYACSIRHRTEICFRLLNVMTPEQRKTFGDGSDRRQELVKLFEKSLLQKMPELPTPLIFSQQAKPESLSQDLDPEASTNLVSSNDKKKRRLTS